MARHFGTSALALVAVLLTGTTACAQTASGDIAVQGDPQTQQNTTPSAASPFLLEPDAQIKGDTIKRETYRSQPAGQNQNWNLDIGRFQPRPDEDRNLILDQPIENFSGMRLRLPLKGGVRE